MAEELASLFVRLGVESKDFKKGISDAARQLDTIDKSVGTTAKSMGGLDSQFGKVNRTSGLLRTALLGVGSVLVAHFSARALGEMASGLIDVNSKFEKLKLSLDTITKGKGVETFEALNMWAMTMPINTEAAIKAYTRLAAVGLTPTIKQMELLIDTIGATGGTTEDLDGIVRALGQMSSLGRATREDLNQLTERLIPVSQILQEELGLTAEQYANIGNEAIESGKVIEALFRGMEKRFGGQAKKMATSWDGLIDQIKSQWTEFQRLVGEAGLFEVAKAALQDVLDLVNRMASDGSLVEWAGKVSRFMIRSFQLALVAVNSFNAGISGIAVSIASVISGIASVLAATRTWALSSSSLSEQARIEIEGQIKQLKIVADSWDEVGERNQKSITDSLHNIDKLLDAEESLDANIKKWIDEQAAKREKAARDLLTIGVSTTKAQVINAETIHDAHVEAFEGMKRTGGFTYDELLARSDSFAEGAAMAWRKVSEETTTWAQTGAKMVTTFANEAKTSMSNLFFNAVTGELSSLQDLFSNIWTSMLRVATDKMAEMALAWIQNVGIMRSASSALPFVGGAMLVGGVAGGFQGMSQSSAAISGALSGAMMGSAFGPPGMVIGAIAGGVLGFGFGGGRQGNSAANQAAIDEARRRRAEQERIRAEREAEFLDQQALYRESQATILGLRTTAESLFTTESPTVDILLAGIKELKELEMFMGEKVFDLREVLRDSAHTAFPFMNPTTGVIQNLDRFELDLKRIASAQANAIDIIGKAMLDSVDTGDFEIFASNVESAVYSSVKEAIISAFLDATLSQNILVPFFTRMQEAIERASDMNGFRPESFFLQMQPYLDALPGQIQAMQPIFDSFSTVLGKINDMLIGPAIDSGGGVDMFGDAGNTSMQTTIPITLELDGRTLSQWVYDSTKNGETTVHPRSDTSSLATVGISGV